MDAKAPTPSLAEWFLDAFSICFGDCDSDDIEADKGKTGDSPQNKLGNGGDQSTDVAIAASASESSNCSSIVSSVSYFSDNNVRRARAPPPLSRGFTHNIK
jgi:hypothetical protein